MYDILLVLNFLKTNAITNLIIQEEQHLKEFLSAQLPTFESDLT